MRDDLLDPPAVPARTPAPFSPTATSGPRGRRRATGGRHFAAPPTSRRTPGIRQGFRPEVQGLRALAVLMVVTYHIWFDRVSGGVDIFLLISAFLMTLTFVRKAEAGTPFGLIRHWLHLFKRLLPAVAVVLLGTLGAALVLLPRAQWTLVLEHSWASLFYFQNWLLAAESVDYYADTSVASPLQHFWSLSIQGQVFVLWPLLFLGASLAAKAFRLRFRTVTAVLFGVVFAVSLAFSIYETNTNQAYAYFDTRARLWEFALGTLLALALPYLRLPRVLAVAAGWLGLAGMLSAGYVLDVEGEFPGFVALWPLLSAALVISAGQTGSRLGADRLLSWGPLVKMGDLSYALYLWHWPILVIYLVYRGRDAVGPVGGTGIIVLSLMLAYVTTRLVERPLRNLPKVEASRVRTLVVIAACLGLVAVPVGAVQQVMRVQAANLIAEADTQNPGAYSLMAGFVDRSTGDTPPIPDLGSLKGEWGALAGECEGEHAPDGDATVIRVCAFKPAEGTPSKEILVIGDSHVEQWVEPLELLAERHNYQLTTLLLGGCNYGTASETRSAGCNNFNEAATAYALKMRPDAVLTMATRSDKKTSAERAVAGLPEVAAVLGEAGIRVVGLRDNPRFTFNMIRCVEEHGAESDKCTFPLSEKLAATPPVPPAEASNGALRFVDMTDLICPDGTCSPVVGNVYVYLDDNHLTTTYTKTTLPEFEKRFHDALR
ncbi:acyltransferase family protein [Arthrobacter zhaoguopingii]|uniref:acyltransferase family protein n=1 Tax=Arthrobacter zhaoguopingii TaxID=2681491 RepID=UPI00135AFBC7|nr:acyltransferase family protein [Arthrobacter zhaoguopingii]